MKLKSFISMMAAVAIVFAGCDDKLIEPEDPNQEQGDPTPDPVVGEITLDGEASLTFSYEGGSQNVSFEATLEWTATSSEEFVNVGPASGEAGEARVTIAVDENQAYDDRTATVTLTCGEDTKTIQVTQKKKGALVLAPSTIQVPSEGQSLSIVVQANSNVTAAIAEDAKAWISELKGLVDYGFTFVIAPNEAVESRTGQIVFTNETGETETITLEQAGTPIVGKITLQGEDAFTVSDEGGQLEVAFNATLGWTASSSEEFVTVEPKTGEAGDVSVTLTVAENDSYDPRTATVTLTCDEDVKTIEITQKQKGALLFTESTIAVSAEGGNVEVVAKANSNVTYAIADDAKAWISELKGLVEYKFNFIVTVNESELARTGQIVFTNETGQTETVIIQQAGTEALTFAANFAVEGVAPFKTLWANGDVVAVNGVVSDALVLDAAAATAEFVVRDKLEAPFNAIYPASVLKAETADVVTLPAQAYVTEVAPEVVLPMAAQAQEKALAFKQLCSVVKFTVKSEEAYKLDYAELSASQKLHGDFTVDYSFATLTAVGATDAEKTLRCELDNELTAEGVNLYFVVPAAEYTSLALRLVDVDGLPMTYTTTETFTAEAGTVVEVPAFEFKPDQISVATAADLVKFATLYNANKLDTKVKVTLVDDIVFDEETNAAWTPIGTAAADNDGAVDNYFSGYINGQGYSIKNWNSTRPLFAYTSSDAVIKDLTIDASCTLTANYTSNNQYYGAFVGYHRGLLNNCHVNADLVGSGNWGNSEPHIGALAGRVVVGTVENCTVNGDVTFDNTLVTGGKNSYFGGAVGRVSNKDGELKGISVKGNVSLSAGSTYIEDGSANANDAFVKYGGIVGQLAGTCTDCHLTEATKKFFYGNFVHNSGVAPVNNNYRTQQVGGIVGEIYEGGVLSNCTNYAAVVFNQYNGEVNGASTDVSRYLYGGGIAGQINGELSRCTMYGSLENRSSCLQQFIGGVVGHVLAKSSVHYCANEGEEIAAGTSGIGYYQARNNNIGGVVGLTLSTNLSNLTNKAELLCSRMNSKNSATLSIGGVIGKIEATSGEIDGQGAIVNYGKVYSNHNQYDNQYTAVGGVIGEARCSVKGVVNEGSASYVIGTDAVVYKHIWVGGVVGYANGELTLTSLENKGTAYININKSIDKKHFDLCVGGVLGTNADAKAVTLVNCVNSGSAAFQGGGTKTNGRSIALGGIVGALTNGASSISGCSNTGCISNTSSNNMTSAWVIRSAGGSNYVGGIAGYIEGVEGDLLEVTNCVNNRTAGTDDKVGNASYAIYTLRGSAGALVGGAKYGDVKNGTVTTYIYNTNSTVTGSVVGSITNSNISNCVATNCTLNPHTGCAACGGCVGETVASTVADITLNGITILEPSATATGAIAGKSDATSTFTNIKLKGQIGDDSISASSTMIAIDPGATVTDIFILD